MISFIVHHIGFIKLLLIVYSLFAKIVKNTQLYLCYSP